MKKIFLTIAMTIVFSTLNAQQWDPNGNNFTTGLVKANAGFHSANPNNTSATVALSWLNNTPRLRIGGTGDGLNTGFQIQTVGDRNLFTINNAGKVGIGTTVPSEMLHVIGNTRTNNLQLNGGNINASIPNITGGWARGILYYNPNAYSTSEIAGIGMFGSGLTPSRIFLGFGDDPWNSTKGIQIKSNGFVGIGTTAPSQKLDVNGNATIGDNNWAALIIDGKDRNDWMFNAHNDGNSLHIRTSEDSGATNTKYIMTMNRDSGNVGIGVTAPKAKLDVNGSLQIRGNVGGNNQVFGNLNFYNANSNTSSVLANIQGVRGDNSYQKGNLSFNVKDGTSLIEAIRVKSNGNVGIGVTAPSEKLDVNGNIASTGTISLGKVASTSSLRDVISLYGDRLGATNMYGFGVESDGTLYNKATNHYRWYLNSNADLGSSAKMELDNNRLFVDGNVGIGTTSPDAKLDIRGIERKGLRIYKNNFTDKYLSFWQGYEAAVIEPIKTNGSTSHMYLGGYDNPTNVYLSNKVGGKVGIGTTNIPSQFKLAVAGKMITEEVTVKLQSAWPDYVFTSAYKLPTLKDVEKQIKENGHLANIPSAKEVSENGIELGEMNKKLLEKVEELTLYTIQQEKAIEKQGKEIDELKALVKKLIDAKK